MRVRRAEAGLEWAEWLLTRAQGTVRRAKEILRLAKATEASHRHRLSQPDGTTKVDQDRGQAEEEGNGH